MAHPKLFMSYSWSTPEHEQWVVDLATQLRDSGVDVILDKWDLKEGHDAIEFMEKMVNDAEIGKVVMICDEKYALKANGRAGGVGTETQIISKEVYEKSSQDKFVAVIAEKDSNGKPYLPTYYKSRIYIDLSETERYAEGFERLLRWAFDKPLYVKPELGQVPSYIGEEPQISLGTTALFHRALEAIKTGKSHGAGAFDEYCSTLVTNLERYRLTDSKGEFDDAVVEAIKEFLPYRNEAIQLFTVVAQYSPADEFIQRIHRLFESLIPYLTRPEGVSQWKEWDFDNYRFIVAELFLYALVTLFKHERFLQASKLLSQQYYSPRTQWDRGHENPMVAFTIFYDSTRSLDYRNQRLKLARASLRADILKERCAGTGYRLEDLMQADFIAYLRAEIDAKSDFGGWWPDTLVFRHEASIVFEIFARAESRAYFERVKALLDIEKPSDLEPLFERYRKGERRAPRWVLHGVDPIRLVGYEKLATRP
jgi:TIR domain